MCPHAETKGKVLESPAVFIPCKRLILRREDISMLKCDFCKKDTDMVVRVALDKDYDRLTVKHKKLYACPECSKKKEEERKRKKEKK